MQFLLTMLRSTASIAAAAGQQAEPNAVVAGSAAVPVLALLLGPFLAFLASVLLATFSPLGRLPVYARLFFCGWIGSAVSLGTGVILSCIGKLDSKLWIAIGAGGFILGTLGSVKEFWGSGGLTVDKNQEKPTEKSPSPFLPH
jgi:hypothetical protein